MKILITGSCGFIGFHLAKFLLNQHVRVVGIDNMNSYYETSLKESRLQILDKYEYFEFIRMDLLDRDELFNVFETSSLDCVINLAAQAGVRHSIDNPKVYIDSNITGFFNVLEACRKYPVKHLIYASSSSVYGGNKSTPFSSKHSVDHPVSLYAATKKSNELMAHAYSHLYNIPTTGLRFFTVYGPYGRPDMAYFSFTKDILLGKPIKVYNHGLMERDFTYIDDIIGAIGKLINTIPCSMVNWDENINGINTSFAPYRIYNIGNNRPVTLLKFINSIESATGLVANKVFVDMQPGDVLTTYADISDLEEVIGFKPLTNIEQGIKNFVDWYKTYYNVT